jgi:hypothetical protein
MGRVASVLTAAIAALVLVGSVAAAPLEREHYSFEDSDTFTDTDCGDPITIDYTVQGSGVFMLKDRRPGGPTPPYVFDDYSFVETFTNVANDKTVTITSQGLYKDVKIEHVEGTVYQVTAIRTGRPFVAYGPDGERLFFDRGRIRYSFLVDTLGDADLDNDVFLGDVSDPDIAGPHPLFVGGVDFRICDLIR